MVLGSDERLPFMLRYLSTNGGEDVARLKGELAQRRSSPVPFALRYRRARSGASFDTSGRLEQLGRRTTSARTASYTIERKTVSVILLGTQLLGYGAAVKLAA